MKPFDIFKFLIGDRAAIERIAGSWWSLFVGAILVLIGGLSRNYDHLDLIHNPEWIIGPYIASGITSFIIFSIVYPCLGLRKITPTPKRITGTSYLSFLSVYWMTAPCALLYAIPVEYFTDLVTATIWNVMFLVIVSIWRVALMTRALNVLTGASNLTCLSAVLFPASVMMCIGSLVKSLSLVGIMSGVKLPPHTRVLQEATSSVMVISFFLSIIFLLICIQGLISSRETAIRPLPWKKTKPPRESIIAATIMVAVCGLMTIPHQIKVQHNHKLESLIKNHRYQEAVNYAASLQEKDFSTIHYLPPDPYVRNNNRNEKYRKLIGLLNGSEPDWLRKTWIDQYTQSLLQSRWGMDDADMKFIQSHAEIKERFINQASPKQREKLFEESSHSSPNIDSINEK